MKLPRQTESLLRAARGIADSLPADAILLITETDLAWGPVREVLGADDGVKLLVAAEDPRVKQKLEDRGDFIVLEIEADPIPAHERMSTPLLRAVSEGVLPPGSDVVCVYNGIVREPDRPEPIDSLSIIHLGEHLERLTAQDLRKISTNIPIETLRIVAQLATEIGREGREGSPVGTLLVVGDTRKVLSMSKPINFNPFRGYSNAERNLRDRRVREQIKDIAQMDGAIIVDRDGIAVAACIYLNVRSDEINVSRGFGSRHWAGAAVSRKTQAVAFVVSQSSGTVRVFQGGEVVMHIEPLSRPHIWQPFKLEGQEADEASLPND